MSTSAQHEHRVAGGYKATISNPNTSEEAKVHAREMLAQMGAEFQDGNTGTMSYQDETHNNRVIGGYKAALNNPNVSHEAKQRAETILSEQGVAVGGTETDSPSNRVLGGYKATLSNPYTSDEAKQRAETILSEQGVLMGGMENEPQSNRALGGYKATLSNPNTSEEAKMHAVAVLEGDVAPSSGTTGTQEEHHLHRVIGGYKATLSNPTTSVEAKEHARKMLKEHGIEEY
ncbi:hypothetical protein FRB95_007222 [Tulasnella sp. JGI-2019a]|nr:hypothetical protein FRB93_013666 [Tulasnella sp. JGI-2019a]KAG9039795.1 hypothetical protein FRB95_007222 [Tulasnella sp. JGI-2019a]